MYRRPSALVIAACMHMASVGNAIAQASSDSLSLQGRLSGAADGTHSLQIRFYDAASGGTLVGTTPSVNTSVSGGIFSAVVVPPASMFNGQSRWWTAVVDGVETGPRQLVTSVPYATNAASGGSPLAAGGEPTVNDRFNILSFDTVGRRFRSTHNSNEFYGMPAFFDDQPEEVVTNWRGTGYAASFYSVAGGPERHTGFGILKGDQIASPVVWLYSPYGRNAFQIRGIDGFRGSPVDPNTSSALFTVADIGVARVGVNTDTPTATLDVVGTTKTHVLQITGGSDLAEPFPASPSPSVEPRPGLILSIDPEHPGALRVATEPYDTKVAGVYSGANGLATGMLMGQEGCDLTGSSQGSIPLAMTGRVWVYADSSNGTILPGDRLTTSGLKPGHAMRVSDDTRSIGAVIGKAMTPVDSETGMVLVLVNLQ